MSYWTRVCALLAVAAWLPIAVGAIGRLGLFRHESHPGVNPTAPPATSDPHFAVPNHEPKEGDPGFRSFEDAPGA